MQAIFSWLTILQREVLRRRMTITRGLKIADWLVILGWLVTTYFYSSGWMRDVQLLIGIGRSLGTAAFFLYIATLIPSMIRRLQIRQLLPIMSILLPFRRQFGVLMFLTAFVHQSFTTVLPYLVFVDFDFAQLPPPLLARHITGFAAWWLLFPLWLTSNDLAVKKLGKWWKRLHKLTYAALFLIMAHVALVSSWWYVAVLITILAGNFWALVGNRKLN